MTKENIFIHFVIDLRLICDGEKSHPFYLNFTCKSHHHYFNDSNAVKLKKLNFSEGLSVLTCKAL